MNFWWVNQNQTYSEEIGGGFLWSPKLKSNGQRNPFYEFMRGVEVGDLVFSFSDTLIKAIGVARSTAYGFPKPQEFEKSGSNWSSVGWRVDVHYYELATQIRPKDLMAKIAPHLPERHSPLQKNGNGLQAVYLTRVPEQLAQTLVSLIGLEAEQLVHNLRSGQNAVAPEDYTLTPFDGVAQMEERQLSSVNTDKELSDTEKKSIVLARRGQGKFRENVAKLEHKCRITEVSKPKYLIASHIKPWRYCATANERLDGANGLLLTPTVDHLFDHGFISFEDSGELILSPVAEKIDLEMMGINKERCKPRVFNIDQKYFLDFHRKEVFLLPDVR